MNEAHRTSCSQSGQRRSRGAGYQESKRLSDVSEIECGSEPTLNEPGYKKALRCVNETEREAQSTNPSNGEICCCGGDDNGRSYGKASIGPENDERAYRNS